MGRCQKLGIIFESNWCYEKISISIDEKKLSFESQVLALFDTSPLTQFPISIISFEYVDS